MNTAIASTEGRFAVYGIVAVFVVVVGAAMLVWCWYEEEQFRRRWFSGNNTRCSSSFKRAAIAFSILCWVLFAAALVAEAVLGV